MIHCSMPLLQGLLGRPEASLQVVQDAVKHYEAAKCIANWISFRYSACTTQTHLDEKASNSQRHPRRKRRRLNHENEGKSSFITSSCSQPKANKSAVKRTVKSYPDSTDSRDHCHWLFRALTSPTLLMRQLAARILLEHKELLRPDMIAKCLSDAPSPSDFQLFGILVELPWQSTPLTCFKWACRAVLDCCRRYARQECSTKRVVLLLHYIQHLHSNNTLFQDYLWMSSPSTQSSSSFDSPLACLICAHSLFLQNCHPTNKAARLLGNFIDPAFKSIAAKDIATTATTESSKQNAATTETRMEEVQEQDEEDVEMEEKEYDDDEEEEDHDDDDEDDEEDEEEEDAEDEDEDEEHAEGVIAEQQLDEEVEEEGHDAEITETEREIVDVVRHFEARLLDINDGEDRHDQSRPSSSAGPAPVPDRNRKQAYLQATLLVLGDQKDAGTLSYALTPAAEQHLMRSICNVIVPPKKPLNLKIFMRRAPTQEEFFRGSLSRNPISSSHLPTADPTVRELRTYIATQLQMSESAELIEILCASKILNLDLKLRVVNQVLWKTHLMENSASVFSSSLLSGGGTFFTTGSGLSMVFSTDRTGGSGDSRRTISDDTPTSSLPPMVVTYRLAGVDGEATEDIVENLEDPDAPSATMSSEEQERLMESKFGLTRLVTDGRGIQVLLRSIQSHVRDSLRRIRRDDVIFRRLKANGKRCDKNASLRKFEKSPPCAALRLMKHCTNLPSNRKKLVDARAPTILLRLLLDVLNAIDDSSNNDESGMEAAQAVSNPTAVMLEDLIETLASDISTDDDAAEDDMEEGSSTLPLLLSSLKHIYLGPQLRKVIAKLLPFLTYGQSALARELAENFESHIKVEKLVDCEAKEQPKTRRFILMDTFVQAAVCLPPNDVCYSLRSELIKCGFVEKLIRFILDDMPDQPPTWSAALWTTAPKRGDVADLEQSWKYYFLRSGIKTAFDMLVGLCRGHNEVQSLVANYGRDHRFMNACHWIESTSDNKTIRIYLNGMGLLAETLLDELKEERTEALVKQVRQKTRDRKKEIADERRSKALVSMSSFGPIAGVAEEQSGVGGSIRNSASSFLAPVLGFFGGDSISSTAAKTPAWMAEMEALEDETGLTCAVCQEGRTLQPSELLGLYCYVKKVSIPHNKGGGRPYMDGTMLLIALPDSLPTSLVDTPVEHHWYRKAKSTGDSLRSSHASYLATTSSSRRPTQITTTVSAGNAIHCTCHAKARSADRNHPKAPKSEWEGASLRNSRVNCNVILPLVSSKSSKVPLVAVDMALTDYQTAIANLLGARPKAMLWAVLHDVRLLLLRMAYGEALNADCGGGSMSSNAALLFYQLLLADMFTNDAEHDSPDTARHAWCLSGGFLAAIHILRADDYDNQDDQKDASAKPSLGRAIADAAPMAALTCIVYHNTKDEDAKEPEKNAMVPHPHRRWETSKQDFLRGLLRCAGRRHALGVEDSGGHTSRKGRPRQSSFSEWDMVERNDGGISGVAAAATAEGSEQQAAAAKRRPFLMRGSVAKIDDFSLALRPMVTLYAILDCLSSSYVPSMDDEMIEESAARLAKRVEECQKTSGIHELLRKAGIPLDHDAIVEELQKGMVAAA